MSLSRSIAFMMSGLVFLGTSAILTASPNKDLLTVIPFTHVGVTPRDGIKLAFFLPCGATYLGTVTSQDPVRPEVVRLAILARQDAMVCTSLPRPEQIVLTTMPTVRKVEALSVPLGRVSFTLADSLDVIGGKRSQPGVEAVYEDNCAQQVGMVIDEREGKVLKVAVLGFMKIGAKPKCPYQQHVLKASYLRAKGRVVRPLMLSPQELERAYTLRVIAASDVRRIGVNSAGVVVSYTRSCQEAPIGPIVTREGQAKTLHVGVLVARFYNRTCARENAVHDQLQLRDVQVPEGYQFAAMQLAIPAGQRLTVTAPQRYTAGQLGEANGLILDYIASCRQPVGVVYARDFAQNLSVGVVQFEDLSRCAGQAQAATVAQPLFPGDQQSGKIYPMRLAGFRYF